jgi:hypothetical protein
MDDPLLSPDGTIQFDLTAAGADAETITPSAADDGSCWSNKAFLVLALSRLCHNGSLPPRVSLWPTMICMCCPTPTDSVLFRAVATGIGGQFDFW